MPSTEVRPTRSRLQVYEIVIDCADPRLLGRFWAEALGYELAEEDPDVSYIEDPEGIGPAMCFNMVAEPKRSKNRLHLDLNCMDEDMEAEVERLTSLGAQKVNVGQSPDSFWTVMVDPEGNEFCLVS